MVHTSSRLSKKFSLANIGLLGVAATSILAHRDNADVVRQKLAYVKRVKVSLRNGSGDRSS